MIYIVCGAVGFLFGFAAFPVIEATLTAWDMSDFKKTTDRPWG